MAHHDVAVRWCEAEVRAHEYANTASNVAFVAVAVAGLRDCRSRRLPRPFVAAELSLCVVAVGSVLFHGTKTWLGELLDEVPMLGLAVVYLWTVIGLLPPRWAAPAMVCCGGGAAAGLAHYLRHRDHAFFSLLFTLQVLAPALIAFASAPALGVRRGTWYAFLALILGGKVAWELERELWRRGACPRAPRTRFLARGYACARRRTARPCASTGTSPSPRRSGARRNAQAQREPQELEADRGGGPDQAEPRGHVDAEPAHCPRAERGDEGAAQVKQRRARPAANLCAQLGLEASQQGLGRIGGKLAGHIGENRFVVGAADDGRSKCQSILCREYLRPGEPRIGKRPPSNIQNHNAVLQTKHNAEHFVKTSKKANAAGGYYHDDKENVAPPSVDAIVSKWRADKAAAKKKLARRKKRSSSAPPPPAPPISPDLLPKPLRSPMYAGVSAQDLALLDVRPQPAARSPERRHYAACVDDAADARPPVAAPPPLAGADSAASPRGRAASRPPRSRPSPAPRPPRPAKHARARSPSAPRSSPAPSPAAASTAAATARASGRAQVAPGPGRGPGPALTPAAAADPLLK
ncbi:N-acylsphingosine amidohydrolase [Aureococcus anophagefferens]|nr:N-acylsphingosine amidohydrolase [Aureococcus anophagefferens]